MIVDGDIGIISMAKHKVYERASECECEVKKWMECDVYDLVGGLIWWYFRNFERRWLIMYWAWVNVR